MNTITISAETPVGRVITDLASKYEIDPAAVTSGLLCGICDKHRRAAAAAAAVRPVAPAPAPAAAPAAPVHKPAPTAGMFDSMPA